jgi:hypothetical protein
MSVMRRVQFRVRPFGACAAASMLLLGAGAASGAPGSPVKVRVYSTSASTEVVVRVTVTEDGKELVAETRMVTNVVSRSGAYPPAQVATEIQDSPLQGLHLQTFEVGVMSPGGEITGHETMTAIVHFEPDATVSFFFGVVLDDAGSVRASRVWGLPPDVQREL